MKPTVITSGSNSGNGSNPQVIPQNTKNMGSATDGVGVGPESNNGAPSHGYSNSRDFPNFQRMGFDPDDDALFSDARLRSRLGRMTDPFSRFDARKRGNATTNESPHGNYFDDDADFFPSEFGSLGGRRRVIQPDTRFFENIPSEFRQYIPEGFGFHSRLDGAGVPQSQQTRSPAQGHTHQQEQSPQYYQTFAPQGNGSMPSNEKTPQAKTLCDAAIQTEDLGQSQVDGLKTDNLNQHGLRNTVDLGIGSPSENDENRGQRAHSAPPQDQGKQSFGTSPTQSTQQAFRSQGTQQNSPPPSQAQNRAHASNTNAQQQPNQPQFPKSYYPPQGHTHPQQQPAQPTTPGGSYVRTIPIFVEGRSEPIINHKEIPAQYQQAPQQNQPNQQPLHSQTQPPPPPQPQTQQHYQQPQQHQQHQQPQQQQHRPSPLNTEQQIPQQNDGGDQVPPQTPHTMASINKIQDIQRDVLDLMMKVEKFTGIRSDKEYAYLDEMLTRNLLKLDTIDTNGKESIRLARKEAIKCIQASINVLEAKAKGNAKTGITTSVLDNSEQVNEPQNNTTQSSNNPSQDEKLDKTNVQEPIPLPPPTHATDESLQNSSSSERTKESSPIKNVDQQREMSPSKQNQNNEELSQNSTGTKD